jgi:hypothetical protein
MVAERTQTRADQRSHEVLDRARRKAIELEANRGGIETVQEIGSGRGWTLTEAVAGYLEDMNRRNENPKPTWPTNTAWNCSLPTVPSDSRLPDVRSHGFFG